MKQFWLKEGDTNMRIFYNHASLRRKKNSFSRLKNDSNQWCGWNNRLQALIRDYFSYLFSARGGITSLFCVMYIDELQTDIMLHSRTHLMTGR